MFKFGEKQSHLPSIKDGNTNIYEIDIKNYQLCSCIMDDFCTSIYKVKHKQTGKIYVAKIFSEFVIIDKILNMAVSAIKLPSYPTIIKYIGYSRYDFHGKKQLTIIMEYVPNSFLDMIQKFQRKGIDISSKFPSTIRQIILVGVAHALKFLLDKKISFYYLVSEHVLLNEFYYPLLLPVIFYDEYCDSLPERRISNMLYSPPEFSFDAGFNISKSMIYSFGIFMYEVVTGSSFLFFINTNKRLSPFQMFRKVVEENLRPEFKMPVNEKIKNLIERCWSSDIEERPTIDEIYNELSKYDETSKKNDYFLDDDVDFNEFKNYVDYINGKIEYDDFFSRKIRIIQQSNEMLREKVKQQKEENEKKQEEIERLQKEKNEKKQEEIERKYKEENKKMKAEIERLQKEKNEKKQAEIERLQKEKNEKKQAEIERLQKENEKMKEEIERLQKEKNDILKNQYPDVDIREIKIIESIKDYKKIKEIDSGGSGKVFKVSKENIFALKQMKNIKNIKSFMNECQIINYLRHPNIIKTYGICLSENEPASILFEFCPTNLNTAIENKSLTNENIVCAVYQIVEGMKFIHFKKIIHRDLKPTNILITDDGTIKICDFGISKLKSSKEQSTNSSIGTILFMAPEILNDDEFYDEKVDVYSFGVVLFFILSGGMLPKIKLFDIPTGKKAEIPNSFTQFAKNLIYDCWNLNAADRPSFKTILNQLEKSKFDILKLSAKELQNVEKFVKQYKSIIPQYDD